LNAYSGIASAYTFYGDCELSLVALGHLPGPLDPRTVYLVFQDKTFVPRNIATADPTWAVPNSRPGDLWYVHTYDPDRWDLGPTPAGPPPDPSCVPEFFADTMLVNGTAYPFLEVEPRQYRFRLLNACQARFLNPRLVYAFGADHTEPGTAAGPAFVQIGTAGRVPAGSRLAQGRRAGRFGRADAKPVAPRARRTGRPDRRLRRCSGRLEIDPAQRCPGAVSGR
jgi:spore coat protein A